MQYIGKIDKNKIGEYSKKIITDDVILTDERKIHILENHKKDYEVVMSNLTRVVQKSSRGIRR